MFVGVLCLVLAACIFVRVFGPVLVKQKREPKPQQELTQEQKRTCREAGHFFTFGGVVCAYCGARWSPPGAGQ